MVTSGGDGRTRLFSLPRAGGRYGPAVVRCSPRSRGLFVALLLTATSVGCSADGERPAATPETPAAAPDPGPEPEPTPEPEPEPPPPPPVVGEVDDVTVTDVSIANAGLFRDGTDAEAAVPIDEDAVDAAVAAATAWLDEHLTDAQAGGPGLVEGSGRSGDAGPATAGLTDPTRPVVTARYLFSVGARGTPEWVRASVRVEREDAPSATATFVFLPDGDDVRLLAADPAANTDVPAAPDDAEADA